MNLSIFCTTWGMNETDWKTKLLRIKDAGYDGVETGAPLNKDHCYLVKNLLQDLDLMLILQQWTEGRDVQQHKDSLLEQMERNVLMDPLFVNSQTGKDYFEVEDMIELLQYSDEVAAKFDIEIYHETHRGRFAYSAHATAKFLDALPELFITADFSHWCCVSESYLDDQKDDLAKAISRTKHIHARVGYPEGPQVTDPRAKEWKEALEYHLEWWDQIVDLNKDRIITITPEFGPVGYLHTLPFTNLPVADQWDINCFMKDMLKKRYPQS